MKLEKLWAKTEPFQSVVTHGVITGIIAQRLVEEFLCAGTREQLTKCLELQPDQLCPFIGYFASLHDIGKIHYSFQAKDPDVKEVLKNFGLQGIGIVDPAFRHEIETGKATKEIWSGHNPRTVQLLSEILAAHHQGKSRNPMQRTAEGTWLELQKQFEKEMVAYFNPDKFFPQVRKENSSIVAVFLMGLVILSDWIASGDTFCEAEVWASNKELLREKVDVFLHSSGLAQQSHTYGAEFHQVWPNIPSGGERELQKKTQALFSASDCRYSMILIEAPMGEGKTEAGVYAALQMAHQWGKNGFYVALPTSATANQMVGRMRRLLTMHHQEETVKLMHAMAWMVDEGSDKIKTFSTEEDLFARNWLLPLRRGLLAPYSVGTVDQAMMAAMFIKYGVLRLLGLSGKALVIDEIHAYDTYMQNILERLLEWCKALEIPVVLLSATLPPEKKQTLLGIYTKEKVDDCYPSISAVDENGHLHVEPITKVAKHQTYVLEHLPILHQPERIAEEAIYRVRNGGCLCVMLNTVSQAQAVYAAIKNLPYSGKKMLFHSRFLAKRRGEIEKECICCFGKDTENRPQQAILVATQVVEQSLDVDFDYFMSAIAPIDLLIQRMGRQFRHEKTPRPSAAHTPIFTVMTPENGDFKADGYVYPGCLLQQTLHLLENRESIRVPEDMAQLVSDGYDGRKVPPEELERWMEHLIDAGMKGAMADQYKLLPPSKKFRPLAETAEFDDLEQQSYLSAQTRLSEPTVRIALLDETLYHRFLPRVKDGKLAVQDRTTAQTILESSVSIRKKIWDKLFQEHDLPDITGEKLIIGVKILEKGNLIIWDDQELGVLWKEDAT